MYFEAEQMRLFQGLESVVRIADAEQCEILHLVVTRWSVYLVVRQE